MKNVTDDEMKQVIGDENTRKLNKVFVGRNRYFPKKPKLMSNEERNRMIVEMARATNGNYKAVAEKFELSESMIYKIVNDGL